MSGRRDVVAADQAPPRNVNGSQPRATASMKRRLVARLAATKEQDLACINCFETMDEIQPKTTATAGPILLSVRKVERRKQYNETGLLQYPVLVHSRGNPSLGQSVSSTCLDIVTDNRFVTGLSTGALCVHKYKDEQFKLDYYHMSRYHRAATAVAARPNHDGQVAVGLSMVGSQAGQSIGPSSSHRRSGGASGEAYGCLLWNIEASSSRQKSPIAKLAYQSHVQDLAFMTDSDTLVMSSKALQLVDLRSLNVVGAVTSSMVVKGLRVNNHSNCQVAFYSDSTIQLWDVRKFISPVTTMAPRIIEGSKIGGLRWSSHNNLLVAVGDRVDEYDMSTTKQPFLQATVFTGSRSVEDFEYLSNIKSRICYVDSSRRLGDIARKPIASMDWKESLVIHAWEQKLHISTETDAESPTRRDYGLNANANVRLLKSDPTMRYVWTWIDRIEELCQEQRHENWDHFVWPASSLVDAGVQTLLAKGVDDTKTLVSDLACDLYESDSRRVALTACGWVGKYGLMAVLSECEQLDEYERSAALALWHGNLAYAVDALQRGADVVRQLVQDSKKKEGWISSSHAEVLELTGLSIAGYRSSDNGNNKSSLWRRSCETLMKKISDSESAIGKIRASYLKCMFSFLLAPGSERHHVVPRQDGIALCDRVAFACRYFEAAELMAFLDESIDACCEDGNLEGLCITGMSPVGVKIVQAFVDRSSDVQTAALISSRVVLPSAWKRERDICTEWLDAYRSLLNTQQLWQLRAKFDVDRAKHLGKLPNAASSQSKTPRRTLSSLKGVSMDSELHLPIPTQIDARCTYCDASLGLYRQDKTKNHWLSKMKSVLSCCPQCRKPLPRCSICMLSLGALNPYMELMKERSTRGVETTERGNVNMSNLVFAEWFTWCIRCKHGGHAHHMNGWFARHSVCPVSDCDCQCQFDGGKQSADMCKPVATKPRSMVEAGMDSKK